MRKILLCAGLLLLGAAGAASAQTSAQLPVTARIESGLGLATTGSVDFGTLNNSGVVRTIDPRSPATGMTAGQILVTGEPGSMAQVTYSQINLTPFGASAPTIPFMPSISVDPAGVQSASTLLANSGSSVQLSASGATTLWVGGSLTVGSSQAPGLYLGTVTVSVTY